LPSVRASSKSAFISVRQQIRLALVEILSDIPLIKKRIYLEETYPLQDSQLPCLVIMAQEDSLITEQCTLGKDEKKYWHRLELVIKAYSKSVAISAELETIEAQVITCIAQHSTLNGLVKNSEWLKTTFESSYEGEQPIGVATLQFAIDYRISSYFPNQTIQ